ncbi:bifunctional 5,10-methylenetetrahydrofolate dehydrogenase/5,10-methenyltetrahydrofolate cyclohydrolase [Candidatus Daviesbacteria bacterium]|nr:bifunctional 5,10-methylenetetrahydrofolate dehydrogenase/5,10-methenyltetrahydrofolate cyclohydrolase [Candidatus Daviesbacteria bacterium]
MKVSGRKVADVILKKLEKEIKRKNLKPGLAIILAGDDPSSRIYVNNKLKAAEKVGVQARLYEFSPKEKERFLKTLKKLNKDFSVHGIIIQYPVYKTWDFDEIVTKIDPQKDVDGFLPESPYTEATALAVWEMLTAFSLLSGFKKTENFLKGKKIVILGRGRTAGGPTIRLLEKKGFEIEQISRQTENPTAKIKKGDVIISATGVKNIINKSNLKRGAYVIGVGVGKEIIDDKPQIYGDINEEEVAKIAKLYCPTIGGIGPLTIVSLLENVVKSAKEVRKK